MHLPLQTADLNDIHSILTIFIYIVVGSLHINDIHMLQFVGVNWSTLGQSSLLGAANLRPPHEWSH